MSHVQLIAFFFFFPLKFRCEVWKTQLKGERRMVTGSP